MKRSEISIIIVIVAISLGIAWVVGNAVLGKVVKKGETVKTITRISADVRDPEKTTFYEGAKNPTVQITIGNSSNQQPLGGQ